VPARNIKNARFALEALRDNLGLLLGRLSSPPPMTRDRLDPPVRPTSYDQLMVSNIAAVPRAREVRSSCRLQSIAPTKLWIKRQ
jgi:hypothetical protein